MVTVCVTADGLKAPSVDELTSVTDAVVRAWTSELPEVTCNVEFDTVTTTALYDSGAA